MNIYSRPRRLSHCRNEAVAKIKESARGTMGRGKIPSSPRAFYFFIIPIFIGTPSGSLCGGVRDRFHTVAVFVSGFTSLVWTDGRFVYGFYDYSFSRMVSQFRYMIFRRLYFRNGSKQLTLFYSDVT